MSFNGINRAAAFALLALLALLVSGCGIVGGAAAPTAVPAATSPAATSPAGQHTAVPLPPTVVAQPTAGGQPTAVVVATPADGQPAARPAFAFEPQAGGPGTTISLRGWGFAANAPVKVGAGFPAYTGGPLGLTNTNARGEWQVRVSLPMVQPSPGPDWSRMLLIALDGNDRPLASAPFAFIFDAQPANPVIGFTPTSGGPGTTVSASGSGYTPGKNVVVRLGVPHPMGEVLAVGNVDASGRWSATFVLPDRLPSGERIPAGQIYLVAMGESNEVFASAPFTFQAPADPPTPAPPPPDNGWQTSHSGDFNGDGLVETLTYRPAAISPRDGFGDAALDANSITVSAVQVLQEGAHGPWSVLSVDGSGANASDGVIASFASDARPQGAAAFRFALGSGSGPLLYLLPLDENGNAFTQALAIVWDESAHAYRVGQLSE